MPYSTILVSISDQVVGPSLTFSILSNALVVAMLLSIQPVNPMLVLVMVLVRF
jgi:hypothetical protein